MQLGLWQACELLNRREGVSVSFLPSLALDGVLFALNTVSIVGALLAAFWWYRSSVAEVTFDPDEELPLNEQSTRIFHVDARGRNIDKLESLQLANKLGSRGALSAAVAAASQAVVYFLPFVRGLL